MTPAERFEKLGRALVGRARVFVHNYPCCGKVVRGAISPDGLVLLENNEGFEYDYLAGQFRVEVKL